MTPVPTSRRLLVGLACLAQVVILGVAVAGPLSARLTGKEILLRVAPVDPIDPFRGAYVALDYPDLAAAEPTAEDTRGTVYLPLQRRGDVWEGTWPTASRRPASGTFLRCADQGRLRCGIESWFLPEGEAAEAGRALADGDAVAVVRVDRRGNAALIEVRPRR